VISSLGTEEFVRFRVGIGKPVRKGSPAGRSYVLGRFTKAEAARLPAIVDGVASALELAIAAGVERAMEQFNRPGALGCDELGRGGAPGSGSAAPDASRGGISPFE
jgi:hypothetical protein